MTDTPLIRAARALSKHQSGVDDFDSLDEALQDALIEGLRVVLGAVRVSSEGSVRAGETVNNPAR
jgi:hypothetical protein